MDELRSALELATDDELQALTELLFRPKLNPLDYLRRPYAVELSNASRQEWLDKLEERFRYLAADGLTVIQGRCQQVSYRQALVQVCQHLHITYSNTFETTELESEVFLHIMEKAWQRLPQREKRSLQKRVRQSISGSAEYQALPIPLQDNPLGLLVKGSSALAVSTVVKPWLLKQIARQFAMQMARQQMAKQALTRGGLSIAGQIHGRVTVAMASRGMAVNAARYATTRSFFAVLGPAMWTWFFADLGWRAIATNHSRIIPVVFALAQIRLTRGDCYELARC
ncbi:hypothetical protein PN498_23690 [Oscillatoria sp. CS-180]|uniref:YaaW family protein n=1 Tax=Oscillatoria sp. CS-180 TaxID=3021720 RepID=UPI00232B35DA|nr:hypothetical protein [Oscillatoria sp. CS-180]MDB9529016.1 hypothetical protein [Oscillatoria sp. CS-180]